MVLVLYGEERCPGLGSAGLALGGVTSRGTQLGKESGSRRRPGASLVAFMWAISGAEGAAPPEVVHRHIREEDEHVRRCLVALEVRPSNLWSFLRRSHPSYDPVLVPYIWVLTAHGSGPGRRPI